MYQDICSCSQDAEYCNVAVLRIYKHVKTWFLSESSPAEHATVSKKFNLFARDVEYLSRTYAEISEFIYLFNELLYVSFWSSAETVSYNELSDHWQDINSFFSTKRAACQLDIFYLSVNIQLIKIKIF